MRQSISLPAALSRGAWCAAAWIAAGLFALARADEAAGDAGRRVLARHASWEDFQRGTCEDGGSNLYASRAGTVQMIHRWDLNNDGFLDIFIGQDHDHLENVDAFVYWGTKHGPQSILPEVPESQPLARLLREVKARENCMTALPSEGGGRSLIADLNGDGFPEIVFCNYIHNYSVDMPALVYWGSATGYSAARRTELPTLMAQGVAAADFNHDGFIDLAFANSGIEGGERFGFSQHRESYVYWNGPEGFAAARRTSLPTESAAACAAAELTGDDYPELIFVNNNSQHKSLAIYFGSPQGFSERRREVRPGGDPTGLLAAELTGDGWHDLAVLHRDDRLLIFAGGPAGLADEPAAELATLGAADCRAADLNRDGHVDLVTPGPRGDASYVYWGSASGFANEHRLELPTLHATDAAVADFNGDGWTDLAFANERDGKTHDVPSYIYWNGPHGFHPADRRDIQGFGAVSAQAADLNADDHPELVLVNRMSGTVGEIDSFIYWGNARHRYSPASMSRLRGRGQGVAAVADFNQDGWPDVAFPEGTLVWGSPDGFSAERRQDIAGLEGGHGVSTADLNRDGYLDLVIPRGRGTEGKPGQGTLLWGGAEGFQAERRTELPVDSHFCQGVTIADWNRDGFLDLAFPDSDTDHLELFWGGPDGYGRHRYEKLRIHSAGPVETADLNGDGWLDLVMGGSYDQDKFGKPSRILSLLWGGPRGFSTARSVQLEGYEAEEQTVADFNRDGVLDIATSNYHAYVTRSLPFFVYWGAAGGDYANHRRTALPAESSSALSSGDFNQDGWLDLVVFSHLVRGDHGVGAHLYWGGPDGFSVERRDWLPTFGPHYSVRRDVGNVYDRRLEERYVSEAVACPAGVSRAALLWTAETPHGSAVAFQVRTAASQETLADAAWLGPQGAAGQEFTASGGAFDVPEGHAWIQYRACLRTPDGGPTPVLHEVTLEAHP